MIKFLDLNTGCSIDGLWRQNQMKGYTFWFPNEQSTNIIYTMPICILSTHKDSIELKIEDNDIFCFIKENIAAEVFSSSRNFIKEHKQNNDCIEFIHNITDNDWEDISALENQKYKYAYVFNVLCLSEAEGEFVCKINIGDLGFIRVGADFYGEYEPTYINLSNMGVEIPETIQKTIYDSNVHEDLKDNILLNRKFKELLSNYWDIVANKGSYKSLRNSLEWFEWPDNLDIKEMWRHDNGGRSFFTDENIMSIFEEKLNDEYENYIKTTYVSLYCSLYDELPEYDSEFNPVLINAIMKWCKEDIALKLSLLAQFFGAFFLPIHMSILHAVPEYKVFTNTIKGITGATTKRDDSFDDFVYVESNIKEDSVFKMSNVQTQVTESTLYGTGTMYKKYNDEYIECATNFGVDPFTSNGVVDKDSINLFASNYYTGPGVIIPIRLYIANQSNKDFIKETIIDLIELDTKTSKRMFFYDIITARNNRFKIEFNFLAKEVNRYVINFTFLTASSKTITKTINFTVEDADNLNINIYKIQAKSDKCGFTYKDFAEIGSFEHFFGIQPNSSNNLKPYHLQYLPYMHPTNSKYDSYNGIKLTRTVIFDIQNKNGKLRPHNQYEQTVIRGLMDNDFLEFTKTDDNGNVTYMIFVSKYFYADLPYDISRLKFNVIRNDLSFYPQFHDFKLMKDYDISNYTLSQYDAVCCAAEINTSKGVEPFRYGHIINNAEWTFVNATDDSILYYPVSSRKPFIASDNSAMKPGYYDVIFKYSLTSGVENECKLDSAFRIKPI